MPLQEPSQNFSTPPSPENSARKRPVSERRIKANRRNALRSTGPKTARGKRTVARNAIKHGLLAREVVITAGDGEEDVREFHALVDGLYECYQPVGVDEEMHVQTIAACWWRKARVIRAENGEIRKRLDCQVMEHFLRMSDQFNLAMALLELSGNRDLYLAANRADGKVSTRSRLSALQGFQTTVRGNSEGLAHMKAVLLLMKSEIENGGQISDKVWHRFVDMFWVWDDLLTHVCRAARPRKGETDCQPSDNAEDKQTDKQSPDVVTLINSRLERIEFLEGQVSAREGLEIDAEKRTFSLPPGDATDKPSPLRSSPGQATVSRHGPTGASATAAPRRKCTPASQR